VQEPNTDAKSEAFRILTIEFKINFFKPAVGKYIVCRSKVVNNGKKIKVSESELFSLNEDQEKLIAKAMVTLIAIPSSNIQLILSRPKNEKGRSFWIALLEEL